MHPVLSSTLRHVCHPPTMTWSGVQPCCNWVCRNGKFAAPLVLFVLRSWIFWANLVVSVRRRLEVCLPFGDSFSKAARHPLRSFCYFNSKSLLRKVNSSTWGSDSRSIIMLMRLQKSGPTAVGAGHELRARVGERLACQGLLVPLLLLEMPGRRRARSRGLHPLLAAVLHKRRREKRWRRLLPTPIHVTGLADNFL